MVFTQSVGGSLLPNPSSRTLPQQVYSHFGSGLMVAGLGVEPSLHRLWACVGYRPPANYKNGGFGVRQLFSQYIGLSSEQKVKNLITHWTILLTENCLEN